MSQITPISETFVGTPNSVYNLLYPGIINGPFSSNVFVNSVLQTAVTDYNILANTLIFYTGKSGANIVVQHYTDDNASINLTNLIELSIRTSSGSGANAFGTVNVAGQSDIIADTGNDKLTIVAGTGILLTTDAPNDSLTITATGGSAIDQIARDTANGAFAKANVANTTGDAAFAKANVANTTADAAFNKANTANVLAQAAFTMANGAIYTAAQIRANISNTNPINYDIANGIISHAASAVTPTTYGGSTFTLKVSVDANGHVSNVTNLNITVNASQMTAGILVVARGGTGKDATGLVNGAILIGNTVNSGYDLNTIANTGTGGILITNGQGTITLAANVIWMRGNVSNTAPINYDSPNGIFSLATSGVTATSYGDSTNVAVFTVNTFGLVTAVTNTTTTMSTTIHQQTMSRVSLGF